MTVIIDGKLGEIMMSFLAVIAILGLAFLFISYPTDEYFNEKDIPISDDPGILSIMGVVILLVAWSWSTCGSDHKENADADYPDGRLTYPEEKT